MKLLLDTHTFIWAMRDPQRLGPRAASAIVDAENVVLVSAVVGWEVSTKHRIGKLPNGQAILGSFGDAIDDLRADELPISIAHGLAAGGFGSAYRDPFDRLLAAQAMVEGAALVTLDPAFADFPVTTLWLTALADLVHRKQVHPRELIEAAIERVERFDPALNAVIHRQFERARADAERVDHDAPFAGVSFLFKDYKGREAGESYHAGVATLHDLDYRPRTDSRFALRVRQGGLIPIGRTNVPQLAAMGTTEPAPLLRQSCDPGCDGHAAARRRSTA